MVRYFELDPMLSQQYDAVWRWIDRPGRQGKTDSGIDLVAREHDTGIRRRWRLAGSYITAGERRFRYDPRRGSPEKVDTV